MISTVTNRVAYQGDGTSAVFAFPYQLQSQSHLAVFVFNTSAVVGGIITPMRLNTDYTFSGSANSQGIYPNGGNIVMNSTPNAQAIMVMFRSSVITNSFQVSQNGTIPSTALNQELDLLTLLHQRAQDLNTRSVRLPDGFFGTFDTSLPANILQSVGKRLIVNSTATGWTFDETAASYIPNTVIVAATNSSITSLGGAATGLFLQSLGSSAPTWTAVNVGSSTPAPVTGILQQVNGGTGTGTPWNAFGVLYASSAIDTASTPQGGNDIPLIGGSSIPQFRALPLGSNSSVVGVLQSANGGTGIPGPLTQYALVYASSATQMAMIPSVQAGLLLQSNGSSPPVWGAFAASNIASGTIGVAFGGTGTSTSYIQYGVVFASSALQLANTPAGGTDIPLIGNTGAAPGYRSLPLQSGSSVTGTLGVQNGGTGTNTSYTQFGLIYASSATQMGTIPVGTSGWGVLSNGTAAPPTFQPITVSNTVSTVQTVEFNVLPSQRVIVVASSNWTVDVYGPVSNAGKQLTIVKNDLLNWGKITIACSSANFVTANGALNQLSMNTPGEVLDLISDGTSWLVQSRFTDVFLGNNVATTTSWTSTVTISANYWREKHFLIGDVRLAMTGAATAANLDLILPNALTADAANFVVNTSGLGMMMSDGMASRSGVNTDYIKLVYVGSTTNFRASCQITLGSSFLQQTSISNVQPFTFAAKDSVQMWYKIPILAWQT